MSDSWTEGISAIESVAYHMSSYHHHRHNHHYHHHHHYHHPHHHHHQQQHSHHQQHNSTTNTIIATMNTITLTRRLLATTDQGNAASSTAGRRVGSPWPWARCWSPAAPGISPPAPPSAFPWFYCCAGSRSSPPPPVDLCSASRLAALASASASPSARPDLFQRSPCPGGDSVTIRNATDEKHEMAWRVYDATGRRHNNNNNINNSNNNDNNNNDIKMMTMTMRILQDHSNEEKPKSFNMLWTWWTLLPRIDDNSKTSRVVWTLNYQKLSLPPRPSQKNNNTAEVW